MAVTHHKSSRTIRGIIYAYDDRFKCYTFYGDTKLNTEEDKMEKMKEIFGVVLNDDEEVYDETFMELSNGKGDDEDE